jgi:transcriptional regulator with PAS, ATPase and Fis domain
MTITLAPLREREDDVLLLAKHFINLTEKRYGLQKHTLNPNAIEALLQYTWPGNVRELRHQISRAVLLSNQTQITAADLALPATKPEQDEAKYQVQLTLDASEKHMLLSALEASHNNVSEAARQLGITRMTMRYRMDKHGINLV